MNTCPYCKRQIFDDGVYLPLVKETYHGECWQKLGNDAIAAQGYDLPVGGWRHFNVVAILGSAALMAGAIVWFIT